MVAEIPLEVKLCFNLLKGETLLIITMGNKLREDDGVGPYIAEHVTLTNPNIKLVNVGDRVENIIEEIELNHPNKVILIDATDFGGQVGEIRLIPAELLPEKGVSTHSFPLKAILAYLKEEFESIEVKIIGIQVKSTGYNEGINREVLDSANLLIKYINSLDRTG